jgi:cholesterol oxidase
LSEKGYRVAVLEQGRRFRGEDLQKANDSLRDLFWMPGQAWESIGKLN